MYFFNLLSDGTQIKSIASHFYAVELHHEIFVELKDSPESGQVNRMVQFPREYKKEQLMSANAHLLFNKI